MLKKLTSVTLMLSALLTPARGEDRIQLLQDDAKGQLRIVVDQKEALVYQYAAGLDLPHYWPLNSPSGRNMLVQKTSPYPHHRSFWFADKVQLDGHRAVGIYNALYSGKGRREPPYRNHSRHVAFKTLKSKEGRATVESVLVWEMDNDKPILDEHRVLRITALSDGEYFLDITFSLAATYGDVHFVSDSVHYAWPYLRINDTFNGLHGGTITNDRGKTGQKSTNMKAALWIDYSNTVDGVAEGLAVFQYPDGKDHRWLTREYGTFGPRRPDSQSGKKFTVKKGEEIAQRVGVLIHNGTVESGRVAERYRRYVAGQHLGVLSQKFVQ